MHETPPHPDAHGLTLDAVLRDVLPELKLALGELIDRENARPLPARYARLLPETLLIAVLRPDAAEAIRPIAAELEAELTASCTRHGSLYDRAYRVQLRRAEAHDAPLFAVAAVAGHDAAAAAPGAAAGGPAEAREAKPGIGADAADATLHEALPAADPDATSAEGVAPAGGWHNGRWLLVVEDLEGAEQEVFRIVEPFTTVGRRSSDPGLRVGIALGEVPHVSRRQLALLWDGDEPEPGFRVFNLGLNPLHLGDRELPGARLGRGTFEPDSLDPHHIGRIGPEAPLRIGEQGPVLRVRELPSAPDDPDATVHE